MLEGEKNKAVVMRFQRVEGKPGGGVVAYLGEVLMQYPCPLCHHKGFILELRVVAHIFLKGGASNFKFNNRVETNNCKHW